MVAPPQQQIYCGGTLHTNVPSTTNRKIEAKDQTYASSPTLEEGSQPRFQQGNDIAKQINISCLFGDIHGFLLSHVKKE
jgi:hypothetical protein